MTTASNTLNPPNYTAWNRGLWTAQIALAGLFGMAVYMHLFLSPDELAQMGIAWAENAPTGLIRFIGLAELAGVIGLLVPAWTRIHPKLTTYAAMGLLAIQMLAISFHLLRDEFAVVPFNLVYVALAVLIIHGRTDKAPIAPRP